ncbi:MAG: BNR-4 repeat-containing protein [Verrucomicrobiota bacterium]
MFLNSCGAAQAAGTITQITADGCWTWFNDPRAFYDNGKLYVGWITKDQVGTPKSKIQFASHDLSASQTTVVDLNPDFQSDDHDNPGLVKNPDGNFTAFYAPHSGTGLQVYYRNVTLGLSNTLLLNGLEMQVPTNSADVTGLKSYNYANPYLLTNDNGAERLYVFSRGLNFNPVYRTREGTNWGAAKNLIDYGYPARPYIKYHSTGNDQICFAFTDAHPASGTNNIYYASMKNGSYYRANGAKIKDLVDGPLLSSNFTSDKVFDRLANSAVTGANSWIWDVALDLTGQPVVTFASFPSTTAHQYHWARWNGTQWIDRIVVSNAGGSIARTGSEAFYSGGIVLDHTNPNIVYLCQQVGGFWNLEQRKTSDGGQTWTTNTIASGTGSTDENIRPFVPLNRPAHSEMVLWLNGTYDYWDFSGTPPGWNTAVKLWTNPLPAPVLQFGLAQKQLILSWPSSFALQSATNVAGPFTNLAVASPYTNAMILGQQFFRLKSQ